MRDYSLTGMIQRAQSKKKSVTVSNLYGQHGAGPNVEQVRIWRYAAINP